AVRVAGHRTPESDRHQLRAQAEPQHGFARSEHLPNHLLLSRQPRVLRLFVHIHRPAEHDEQLDRGRIRRKLACEASAMRDVYAARGELHTACGEKKFKGTQALMSDVLEDAEAERRGHRTKIGLGDSLRDQGLGFREVSSLDGLGFFGVTYWMENTNAKGK